MINYLLEMLHRKRIAILLLTAFNPFPTASLETHNYFILFRCDY